MPSLTQPLSAGRDLITLHALRPVIREYEPDIVHTHTAKAGFLGRAAALTATDPAAMAVVDERLEGKISITVVATGFGDDVGGRDALADAHVTIELDGVAVVTALRAVGNDIPICVLSARVAGISKNSTGVRPGRRTTSSFSPSTFCASTHAAALRITVSI